MKIDQVFEAIKRERAYQDAWGTFLKVPNRVGPWLNLIREKLYKAEAALEFGDKRDALREILQLVAVGVACLEQHGVVERDELMSERRFMCMRCGHVGKAETFYARHSDVPTCPECGAGAGCVQLLWAGETPDVERVLRQVMEASA